MAHTTISARIPRQLKAALEVATEDEGLFESEVIRAALRYYVDNNPDDIAALEQDHGERHEQHDQGQYRPNEPDYGVNNILNDL